MKVLIRTGVICIALFSLTGCGSTSNVATSPTPTATVSSASLVCSSAQLAVQLGIEQGAMGSVGIGGMQFINRSSKSCTLKGYPVLQMISATNRMIPTFTLHGASYSVPPTSAKLVMLNPGGVAKFDVLFSSQTGYGSAICPTSAQVAIRPPGAVTSIVINWKIQPYGGGTIQTLRCGEIKVSPVYGP